MATALDRSFPFDLAPLYRRQWEDLMGAVLLDGYLRGEDSTLTVSASSAGMTCSVATGKAVIRGHYGENTSAKTLTLPAADPDLPRVDLVVAYLDQITRQIGVDIVAGTPSSSPSPPALTQDAFRWEIPLATIAVAAGTTFIASGDVTDQRMHAVPAHAAGGLAGSLSVAADAVTGVGGGAFPGWSATRTLRAGRKYRFRLTGRIQASTTSTRTLQIVADGVTTVAKSGSYSLGVVGETNVLVHGIVDWTEDGPVTFTVTSTTTGGTDTLFGTTTAAVTDTAAPPPRLTIEDLGPT